MDAVVYRWFKRFFFIIGSLGVMGLLIGAPARSAAQTRLVLISRQDKLSFPDNLHILEDYNAFVLAEVADYELAALAGRYSIDRMPERTAIRLNGFVFDTAKSEPVFGRELQASHTDPYFLIQFYGPIKKDWLVELSDLGVAFLGYHPNFTYIVRMDPARLPDVQAARYVEWVGRYHPGYRMPSDEELQRAASLDGKLVLDVSIFSGEEPVKMRRKLEGLGVTLEWFSEIEPMKARVWAAPEKVALLASLSGVYRVQAYDPPVLYNERAAQVTRTKDVWRASRNGLPQDLMGEGQIVGMVDTGLDNNSNMPLINDFYDFTGGLKTSRIQAALAGNGCLAGPLPFCDCYASDNLNASGHGTHVAGSMVANGYNALRQRGLQNQASGIDPFFDYAWGAGQAPEAKIVFAHVSGTYLIILPGTLCGIGNARTTWQNLYDQGARNVNNSWGSNTYNYGGFALDADGVMWDNQDYLVVAAAGNAGPGWNTVGQPGSGKNLLTVGASSQHRSGWGLLGDSASLLTNFSSRGPVNPSADGRSKPDIVTPGAHVLSTRTTFIDDYTSILWGNETGDGDGDGHLDYVWSGGTSMSTPTATGATTIVRDYLQDIQGFDDTTPPSAALIKAMLANGAVDLGYGYESFTSAPYGGRNMQGWGMINLEQTITPRAPRSFVFDDFTGISDSIKQSPRGFDNSGDSMQYTVEVVDSSEPLKVTLSWTDRQTGSDGYAVNDLDLLVTAPDGTSHYQGNHFSGAWSATDSIPDRVNNTEAVYIQNPPSGIWIIQITAYNISGDTQPFALVASGGLGPNPSYTRTCSDTTPDCNGRIGTSGLPYFPSIKPLDAAQEHTPAGSSSSTSIRLTNWGANADMLSLNYSVSDMNGDNAPDISVTFSPGSAFGLATGAWQEVQLTVKVGAAVADGPYDVTITASSTGNGTQDAQVIGLNVIRTSELFNEARVVQNNAPQFAPDFWGTGSTLWVTYLTAEDHNNSEASVWTMCSSNGGQSWTDTGQIDANDGRYYFGPAIEGSSDGSLVTVVWSPVDFSAVYARTWTRTNGCTGTWGPIKMLSSYGGYLADVVYDKDGDILVVWFDGSTANSTDGVMFAQSTDHGDTWSIAAGVPDASGAGLAHRDPQLTLDTVNNDVWMAYAHDANNRDVRLKRWDGDANAWDPAGNLNVVVADGSTAREHRPGIGYINGALWVTWHRFENNADQRPRLYYARLTGLPTSPVMGTVQGPYGDRTSDRHPAMVVGDENYAYIAYLAYEDSLRGGNVSLLRAPQGGGPVDLVYQASATTDNALLYSHGNAGTPRLGWASTTVNGVSFSGPTLLYSKNSPDSQSPGNGGNQGASQALFDLSENFDLYLMQARSYPVPVTYADTEGLCDGNTPCYISFQKAIDDVDSGGIVYVYPRLFNETVLLNKNATVKVLGDATVDSLSISAGTFNAPTGTLTLRGDFNLTGGVFAHRNGTLSLAGSATQTIAGSLGATFHHLAINNPSDVSLNQGVTVEGSLVLNDGLLILGDHHLTMGVSAMIGGSPSVASMVVANGTGELRKQFNDPDPAPFTFPVGDNSGVIEYSPATLDFSGMSGSGYVALRLTDSAHPNNTSQPRITRYWSVTQNGLGSFSCDATFNYTDDDLDLGSGLESDLRGARYDGDWTYGGPVDALNNRFSMTVTSFSDFTAGPQAPTAVQIGGLVAVSEPEGVRVGWEAAMQLYVLGFNVYRSTSPDGELMQLNEALIPVNDPGDLSWAAYAFLDESVQPGIQYYYWLEILNFEGSETFGPVSAVGYHWVFVPLVVR